MIRTSTYTYALYLRDRDARRRELVRKVGWYAFGVVVLMIVMGVL